MLMVKVYTEISQHIILKSACVDMMIYCAFFLFKIHSLFYLKDDLGEYIHVKKGNEKMKNNLKSILLSLLIVLCIACNLLACGNDKPLNETESDSSMMENIGINTEEMAEEGEDMSEIFSEDINSTENNTSEIEKEDSTESTKDNETSDNKDVQNDANNSVGSDLSQGVGGGSTLPNDSENETETPVIPTPTPKPEQKPNDKPSVDDEQKPNEDPEPDKEAALYMLMTGLAFNETIPSEATSIVFTDKKFDSQNHATMLPS